MTLRAPDISALEPCRFSYEVDQVLGMPRVVRRARDGPPARVEVAMLRCHGVLDWPRRRAVLTVEYDDGEYVLDVDDADCRLGRPGTLRAKAPAWYAENPLWLLDLVDRAEHVERIAGGRVRAQVDSVGVATAPKRWRRTWSPRSRPLFDVECTLTSEGDVAEVTIQLSGMRLRVRVGEVVAPVDLAVTAELGVPWRPGAEV